jgi:hypothetical protein
MHAHVHSTSTSREQGRDILTLGRRVNVRQLLIGLLAFNGIGAVSGGIGLIRGGMGLPLRLLEGTPFSDYMTPGLILALIVGTSSLAAAIAVWKRAETAGLVSIVAGAVLLGWIVTEFVMIPSAWIPQLLFFLIALVILRLGRTLHKERNIPL